ncbi:MAG: hypothetical protein KDB29_10190, partial [Planctomycetes bacterium]|nr:hypothetical protein [Planctomycetota bacterium]
FAPDAADWTVSRLENLSLMSFWENACLADVIARLRGRGLHLAASYEIDDQSESTSPAGRHDTATLLAYLESEQGATWVLNGGLLTLVSSETGLSVQSGMGGTFSSIFGTDYKFAHRGVSEDASFNALGDFQVFNEESEQDVDQAAELHKRLLAELDTLLNFSPKTEPEALDAVNCANACLIALHHAHPLLLAEPDRRLYALRAQLLLAQARDVLHVYRPNAYTLVHPFLSLDGHTLEVARNAYSGEIFQYTWLGD